MFSNHFVILGRIGAPFGIKGFLHVYSYTKNPKDLMNYKTWYLNVKEEWQPHQVLSCQAHGKGFVAQLEGITDRNEALKLTRLDIGVLRESLPKLPKGDYYWTDLIGLQVFSDKGEYFGKVLKMVETGSNDVLVVGGEEEGKEHWIPYIPNEYVLRVDLEAKLIEVRWDLEF